eukprot:11020577-Heterocapsa_arctica.AAC.1
MLWPFSASAARAGRPVATATSRPSAAPRASGLQALVEAGASTAAPSACAPTAWRLSSGAALSVEGATKQEAP